MELSLFTKLIKRFNSVLLYYMIQCFNVLYVLCRLLDVAINAPRSWQLILKISDELRRNGRHLGNSHTGK